MRYLILHRSLAPLMMASTPPAGGEGEDTQTGGGGGEQLPEGVERVHGGDTLRAVADRAAIEKAAKDGDAEALPAGFTSWQAYADHLKANPAAPAEKAAEGEAETDAAKETRLAAERETAVTEALTEWPEDQREKAQPFVTAYAETGTLTDEQVTEAAKAFNLPESAIRQYMAGADAITVKSEAEAATQLAEAVKPFNSLFGGETQYKAFQTWGAEGLTDAEKEAFNEALDRAPKAALAMAETFKARFEAQGGAGEARDLTELAGAEGGKETDVYASDEEFQKDLRNPQYASSEEFRQKVYAKLGRSSL